MNTIVISTIRKEIESAEQILKNISKIIFSELRGPKGIWKNCILHV